MKKSISIKLFITIFLAFIMLVSGIMISLDIYFNKFYESEKIRTSAENLKEFSSRYNKNKWSNEELLREIDLYSSKYNVEISVNKEGLEGEENEESHEEESKLVLITTVDKKGKYFDFFVSSEVFSKMSLKKGDDVFVKGNVDNDSVISLSELNGKKFEWKSSEGEGDKYQGNLKIVEIKENLSLPTKREEEKELKVIDSGEIDGLKYKITEIPYTKNKQITFTSRLGESLNINVTSSLQSVNETLEIIKKFFPYFFVSSIILSFIIAGIYSVGVTKPIISITESADLMAKMDFSVILDEEREDELGRLALSLNTLSYNLEKSLKELKEANEKLKEDYEKEIKQEEARKEFIANASHELKTPLGIIRSYAEGIKDKVNESERNDYIDIINDEIDKMDKLILEMLKISKYDSTDMIINKEEVDLILLINDIIQGFERKLFEKRLLLSIEGEFKECYIDREKVGAAFLNLFSNAVKYSRENSKIKIKGEDTSKGTRVEIFNECEPFTKEQLEKVWDRFYKLDLSHTTDVEGTGLGLSIVKSIFDTHEIDFGVFNRYNGIVFWFEVKER